MNVSRTRAGIVIAGVVSGANGIAFLACGGEVDIVVSDAMLDDVVTVADTTSEDAGRRSVDAHPCPLCNLVVGCLDAAPESDAPWATLNRPCEGGEQCLHQTDTTYACCDPLIESCR